MIEFLSGWMRGLILVIFFAIVLDMILPKTSMQRYARLVMGMLIVLMMLTPVLKIYKTPLDNMDFSLDSLLSGTGGQEGMKGIDEILANGSKMQQSGSGQTVEQWKRAIGELIKASVEQTHKVKVAGTDLKFTLDQEGLPKTIEGVTITLASAEDSATSSGIQSVKPVEPIQIGGSGEDTAQTRAGADSAMTAAHRETASSVRSEVAAELQLKPSQINIVWQDS
jgi:stage III sporulation protein AF